MFSKKKEIAIKIKVQPEKLHYLLNEQIRANLVISSTAPIEIETITCFLNGFERSFDLRGAKPQENRKKFYEHGPTFIFKPEKKGKGMQLAPNVDHNIPFMINPIFRNISGSCLLDNKLGVIWQIIVDVNLTRREASFSTTHEVHIHMGHQVYIQHAPQSSIVSVQKFFKHSPIEYRVLLHKTTFISNEAVSMTLDIKNQTRMDLISMTTELVQTWSSLTSRFTESLKLLKFDINSPPLFPIPPKTDRHKEIQFKLPERLPPSVVSISKNDTPVLISYHLSLEFLTNKSDKHQIIIPILVEDNYPQREPLPPPVISPPLPAPTPTPNPNPNSLPQFSPTPDGSIQLVQPQYTTMPVMQMPAVAGSMYYNLPGNAQASMANFQQQALYPQIPLPANYQTPNLPVDIANGNQINANNVRFSAPPLYPLDVNSNNNNNNFNNNNGTFDLSANNNGPLQVNVKDDLLAQELQYVDLSNDFGTSNQNNNNHNSNPVMFDNNSNNDNNNMNNNNSNYNFVVTNDDQNNNHNNNNNDNNNPNMSQNNYFGSNVPVFGYQIVDGNNNVQYFPYFQGADGSVIQQFTQVPDYGQVIPQDMSDRPPAYNPNI